MLTLKGKKEPHISNNIKVKSWKSLVRYRVDSFLPEDISSTLTLLHFTSHLEINTSPLAGRLRKLTDWWEFRKNILNCKQSSWITFPQGKDKGPHL